jgi:hypothetical protein
VSPRTWSSGKPSRTTRQRELLDGAFDAVEGETPLAWRGASVQVVAALHGRGGVSYLTPRRPFAYRCRQVHDGHD